MVEATRIGYGGAEEQGRDRRRWRNDGRGVQHLDGSTSCQHLHRRHVCRKVFGADRC
ncbi:MAG: hypothetical protein MZV70_03560 [Desulfobacterales bacterium]|nr:hypothetical protein [Desulfobacterales bacterium]